MMTTTDKAASKFTPPPRNVPWTWSWAEHPSGSLCRWSILQTKTFLLKNKNTHARGVVSAWKGQGQNEIKKPWDREVRMEWAQVRVQGGGTSEGAGQGFVWRPKVSFRVKGLTYQICRSPPTNQEVDFTWSVLLCYAAAGKPQHFSALNFRSVESTDQFLSFLYNLWGEFLLKLSKNRNVLWSPCSVFWFRGIFWIWRENCSARFTRCRHLQNISRH